MVYLDGKLVDPAIINPTAHRFVGAFRPPVCPDTKYTDDNGEIHYAAVHRCPCGSDLWTLQGMYKHYIDGHFDIPQYVTIHNPLAGEIVAEVSKFTKASPKYTQE